MLDERGGAGHGEQNGQVGIGSVGGKTQSSPMEMNTGPISETLWGNRHRNVRNPGHLECISNVVKFSVVKQFQIILQTGNLANDWDAS